MILVQIKTPERDGYTAVQVGYRVTEDKDFSKDSRKVTRRRTKVTKSEAGHCKKAGAPLLRTMREFKVRRAAICRLGWLPSSSVVAEMSVSTPRRGTARPEFPLLRTMQEFKVRRAAICRLGWLHGSPVMAEMRYTI